MTEDAHERDPAPQQGADGAPAAEGAAADHAAEETAAGAPDADIEALRREKEEHWNQYLRTVAELDNLRKRNARELETARRYAAERLGQAVLPVRDSLEAALAVENATVESLLEGSRATLKLLDQALESVGIALIDPAGEPFDPTRHEAMTVQPTADQPPDTVVMVIQKGYELHDRLLRPARVVVAAPLPASDGSAG